MNKKELMQEVEDSEIKFRVTMDGSFEDFDTLHDAVKYTEHEWNKGTYYVSIRQIAFK